LPILLVLCAPALARATAITIDGKYADWANVTTFADPDDNVTNDIKSLAITDNLGADGKPGATDHLYLKLEMWGVGFLSAQSIILEYPDGTKDTLNVWSFLVTGTSCQNQFNCVTFDRTTDAVTGVITWEMSILFSDLSDSFAKDSKYTLKAYVSSSGGND